MTREEHIKWCKDRAIKEYDFYAKTSCRDATRNGMDSMMSDINKHEETRSTTLQSLCVCQLIKNPNMYRQEFVNFINGFN